MTPELFRRLACREALRRQLSLLRFEPLRERVLAFAEAPETLRTGSPCQASPGVRWSPRPPARDEIIAELRASRALASADPLESLAENMEVRQREKSEAANIARGE